MVNLVRKNTDIPMVFMTYANVVHNYRLRSSVKNSRKQYEWNDSS